MKFITIPSVFMFTLVALLSRVDAFSSPGARYNAHVSQSRLKLASTSTNKASETPRVFASMGKTLALSCWKQFLDFSRRPSHSTLCYFDAETVVSNAIKISASVLLAAVLSVGYPAVAASDGGASVGSNAKITTGGASTLQSGRTIAITRGVNLDGSDFSNQNLKGVAFQQSIVRDASFKGSNLVGSSFFDATVDGSDFEGADMTLANVEMAQFNRANLKVHNMHCVVGRYCCKS